MILLKSINIKEIINQIKEDKGYYKSWIDNDQMDIGVLYLEPKREDTQLPHNRDEIYFILEGDGKFDIGMETHLIEENCFYFVPKGTDHKLKENTKRIIAIYFFGG